MQLMLGVFLACLAILAAQTLIRYYWILPTFEAMAEDGDRQDLDRVASQVNQELESLHKLVYDSAVWDAMHDAAASDDAAWFSDNFLIYESFRRIDVNGWYLYDTEGRIISGRSYDETGNVIAPEQLDSLTTLFHREMVSFRVNPNSLFTLINEKPAVVVHHQVLRSEEDGESTGTLLIWRRIDQNFVDSLTPGISNDITFHNILQMPTSKEAIAMQYGQPVPVQTNTFFGRLYMSVNSEQDVPLFALSIEPRQRQYSDSLFDPSLLVGLLITLSVISVFYVWINRQLITPISNIHDSVSYAMRHRDFSIREVYSGRNEAFRLGRKLNEMFALIDHQRTELLMHNKQLEKMSNTDPLTGLSNRRHLDKYLENLPLALRTGKQPLAVLIADVDYFKRYNDHYGHAAGDAALVKVANVLRSNTRANSDLVVRYGGEEFLIVLLEASAYAASKVAETLLEEIHRLAIPHTARDDGKQILTISAGIAYQRSGEPLHADVLLKRADEALYKAKSSGRDRFCISGTDYSAHLSDSVSAAE